MIEQLSIHYEPNIITTIGLVLIITFLGSKIFQRFGSPQVVGFIVVGLLLGESFLNIIPGELIDQLSFISSIALGLIGFDMGSHLKFPELRKLGNTIFIILLFEAVGTFLLVTAGIYAITQSLHMALIFGAISSATAPAATVDVLAEYKAGGPLTNSLLAVIGLDDALALLLYSVAASFSSAILLGEGLPPLLEVLQLPFIEIGGSLLLALVVGFILDFILKHTKRLHDSMAISIGSVLLCVGLSQALGFSLILTTMILGIVIVNRSPEHGKIIRFTIEQAGPVVYVLFFALVGARFQISALPTMGIIGIAYIILRSVGKFTGAWVGGTTSRAEPAVRNNLGFGLLTQGGVAIGMAIESARRFSEYGPAGEALAATFINVIAGTTFVVEIIGPIFVKFAISRAGEIGGAKSTPEVWASEGAPE